MIVTIGISHILAEACVDRKVTPQMALKALKEATDIGHIMATANHKPWVDGRVEEMSQIDRRDVIDIIHAIEDTHYTKFDARYIEKINNFSDWAKKSVQLCAAAIHTQARIVSWRVARTLYIHNGKLYYRESPSVQYMLHSGKIDRYTYYSNEFCVGTVGLGFFQKLLYRITH